MAFLPATILVTFGLLMMSVDAGQHLRCSKNSTHMSMTFTAEKDPENQKLVAVKSTTNLTSSRCESSILTPDLLQIIITTLIPSRRQAFPDPNTQDCLLAEGDTPTKVNYIIAGIRHIGFIRNDDVFYKFYCDSKTADGNTMTLGVEVVTERTTVTTTTVTTTPTTTTTGNSTAAGIHGDRILHTAAILVSYVATVTVLVDNGP